MVIIFVALPLRVFQCANSCHAGARVSLVMSRIVAPGDWADG